MPDLLFIGDALPPEVRATIHALLVEIGQRRSLSRAELRLRCITAPRPWKEAGVSYSTWYRRRRKQRLLAERHAEAA